MAQIIKKKTLPSIHINADRIALISLIITLNAQSSKFTVMIDFQNKMDGTTTDITIFNISLISVGNVYASLKKFSAIGTTDNMA